MKKKIIRREFQPEDAALLGDLPPILRRIFAARHIKSTKELDFNFDSLLPYQDLLGIGKAIELLVEAVTQKQRILVVGDFDADGATSTTVAIRALRSFGVSDVNFLVPNRFAYGYGLTPELVNQAREYTPDLIITVDNGIANNAGVDAAKALGIKVLITDHHLAGPILPNADAIVNPNQPGCKFKSKNLAGVGVIFYVMLALRRQLVQLGWFQQQSIPEPNMSKLLDIVALGTVADLVPLDYNNRILVHHGMRRIRAGQCIPAIIGLLELAGRDYSQAVAADLGFAVAARLNAAGRLDDMSLGIMCLLSDDSIEARKLARTLDQLNLERRSIEQDMQAQALQALSKFNMDTEMPRGIVLYDDSWHQGVIGILAARIKDRYHRPVIVLAPGDNNELKGSARSINGFHVRDALALIDAQCPGLLKKFGGHAMAAGLTIDRQNLEKFIKIFDEVVTKQVDESQLEHSLISDGGLEKDELCLEVASLLRESGPWGQAFPEPIFDDAFRVLEQRIVGDKHLKMRLAKDDKIIDAVAFFIDTTLWPNHRCENIHAAYRLDVNEYKGRRNVQLIVEYLEAL